MFQINRRHDCDEETYFVTEYSEGYKGRTVDCVYEDGISYTDWCIEVFETEEAALKRVAFLSSR